MRNAPGEDLCCWNGVSNESEVGKMDQLAQFQVMALGGKCGLRCEEAGRTLGMGGRGDGNYKKRLE